MADVKHTPGPWAIEYRTEDQFTYSPRISVGPAFLHYSAGYHTEKQDATFKARAEANARLIAAAPELLEALQWIVSQPRGHMYLEVREKAAAALAKATGEGL